MKKLSEKFNIVMVFFLTILMAGGLLIANLALAANTATQEASTAQATSISVVGKVADTAITTITFPEAAPLATVSAPYNDVDTSSDPQFLDGSASEPVVRLKNSSGGTLNVTLGIDTWTNGVVASEDYELVASTTVNINAVAQTLSSDGNSNTVATGVGIATNDYNALYLELVLSSVAAKTSSSTLTILGETP